MEGSLEKKRETVKERIEEEKQAIAGQAEAEAALQKFRTARGALAFLRGCEDEITEGGSGQVDASPQCQQDQCEQDAN